MERRAPRLMFPGPSAWLWSLRAAVLACSVTATATVTIVRVCGAPFIRGDANQDGAVDVSDGLFSLNYLFTGGPEPECLAAADANDDEGLDIADAIKTFVVLFSGVERELPPPWPDAGTDPTPGIGCGAGGPESLLCTADGPAVDLSWTLTSSEASGIEVLRDGTLIAELPAGATTYRDHPLAGGNYDYGVRAAGEVAVASTCRVTGLPRNQAPVLTILAPANGTLTGSASVEVRGRVVDDSRIARVVVSGDDIDLSSQDSGGTSGGTSFDFTATAALPEGPSDLRVEVVDEFGIATWREVAVGRRPILRRGDATPGLAFDVTGSTGYDEIEVLVRPFLDSVPALINDAIRGVVLYDDSVLGVDIRVTGDRAVVSETITFDFYPSDANGGRIGVRANFPRIELFANGRSDFGIFGTDNWTAVWDGRNVAVDGTFALEPASGGSRLVVISDGFRVTIGSSSVSVRDFVDPLGIFDAVVNLLASLFNDAIESEVQSAVERTLDDAILPILQDAFSGLDVNLVLDPVALQTTFHDARESLTGLTVYFNSLWTGLSPDPTFPRFPGSRASFAPLPVWPLSGAVPTHAVDATVSLSSDTLNQALYEVAASGLLTTTLELTSEDVPFQLNVGALATLLDERLAHLQGVTADTPIGVEVRVQLPPELVLGAGVVGQRLVAAGAPWRYLPGAAEPPSTWTSRGFNDVGWQSGPSGFGYSSNPAELQFVGTELPAMANGDYTSLYTRAAFTVEDPGEIPALSLAMLYDDGFVAFLNGTEVARRNVPGDPGDRVSFDDLASGTTEPTAEVIDISSFRSVLRAGTNVLAIQGHNAASTSSDFVLLAELAAPPSAAAAESLLPAQLVLPELRVRFLADPAGDGVAGADGDGVNDDVELLSYGLGFRLQAALALRRDGELGLTLEILIDTSDGDDPDSFPDSLVGGAPALDIHVRHEAVDANDEELVRFAQFLLSVFGASLGESLSALELPAIPLPELAFDLDNDGENDVALELTRGTLIPVDTDGDRNPDWVCILADLTGR